jgi:hypothetical protein
MRSTTTILLASAVLVGALGVFPTAAATATCETAEPVNYDDVRSGAVAPGVSHWYHHVAAGGATYTLSPAAGTDVDLFVYPSDCSSGWLCDSQNEGSATDVCSVDGGANYRVEVYGYDGPGGYTISFNGDPVTQCSDGVDNDADGTVDYQSDPGCSGPTDTSEGPTCPSPDPAIVLCLEPTGVWIEQGLILVEPTSGPDNIAAHVDSYRFTVGSTSTTLPCVTLVVDGGEISPCAAAGGVFVSRVATLLNQPEPGVGITTIATVRICHAELTATVLGFGVQSAQAYALC